MGRYGFERGTKRMITYTELEELFVMCIILTVMGFSVLSIIVGIIKILSLLF